MNSFGLELKTYNMTKNINDMSIEEIELELGTEVASIRKRLLANIYEKKIQESYIKNRVF